MNPDASKDRGELFFGLVGPAGVNLALVRAELAEYLPQFGYKTTEIRVSDLLQQFTEFVRQDQSGEYARIVHLQEMGLNFRKRIIEGGDGAALARAAIARIRSERASITKNPDVPESSRAYILDQFKHPDEIALFRRVYGNSFFLLAAHAPRNVRIRSLARAMAEKEGKLGEVLAFESRAGEIIGADEKQDHDLGQNTRDTYPLGDFFANLGRPSPRAGVRRFVDLLFAHPLHTPTPEEFAMYQASSVALRSADSSRQVGAAIVAIKHDAQRKRVLTCDVIATGMNEVPKGGGGFYWDEDSPDFRDQPIRARGETDRAQALKLSALAELIERIRGAGWLTSEKAQIEPPALASDLLPLLKRTQFMDIGEFMRPVHAEMAALIDGARRGVSVNGHTMYVTTFPCHNCAKHIIAAGLQKVVYLEPYPKSKADFLHGEEIELQSAEGEPIEGKVVFANFSGIAPRQYQRLFNMTGRGDRSGLSNREWNANRVRLFVRGIPPNLALAYTKTERHELEGLPTSKYAWDKALLCPS